MMNISPEQAAREVLEYVHKSSPEPRIIISQQFLSLNKACMDKYFKDTERVKIGYDEATKKLILVPLSKEDTKGMKIINNVNSTSRYIYASRVF